MSTLLDRPWITCCARADLDGEPQPPYLHLCGPPAVASVCVSEERDAELIGESEFRFSAGGVEYSLPPKSYRKFSTTMSDFVWRDLCCFYASGTWSFGSPDQTTMTYSGLYESAYDKITGVSSVITNDPALFERNNYDCATGAYINSSNSIWNTVVGKYPDTDVTPVTIDIPGHPWDGEYEREATSNTVGIDREVTSDTILCGSSSGLEYVGREVTTTLSDPDTEADALDRATATAGTSCSSLYEQRTTDFDFTVRTSSYALRAGNLIPGARYTARVAIERRPAIKNPEGSGYVDADGEPSEWESTDDDEEPMIDEYTFTAADRDQIVPTTGTWSDADEDGAIDTTEVTPLIALPVVPGWEYRIASGYPKIELALTSA
ncbi:hypothetical protein QEH52_01810 [Coraliomargarita sp. SDUM461003]|uniref:Uncharacterized protein n=1 Tax=Thalassobacterium maritimum TaxID=3041265 RepID=A0ABU1APX4_9BACT|nr:hypothetical protein [Coraliomargarita sp. SDUM461003]MDQ8206228.1 hypothetical protein [Coraliomargarita sp. SDUM461003]